MQIELEEGENLTIVTERGSVVLQWMIHGTGDLIVGIAADSSITHVRTSLDKTKTDIVSAQVILEDISED